MMGLFGSKMSKSAGEWAAAAMGCMVFADGAATERDIAAAQGQVVTNPLFRHSIGEKKAGVLFKEAVDAIGQIPGAMLPTYEVKLAQLAEKISKLDDKNFALSTVIAVSMGDGTLTQSEYAMLFRFQKTLGANIPIPTPGQSLPEELKPEAAPAPAPVAQPTPAAPEKSGPVACSKCSQPTQFYEGYGHWCSPCQLYTT
jgi:hypothetical protein